MAQVTLDGEVMQQLFVRDHGLVRLVERALDQVPEGQATEQVQAKPYEGSEGCLG